MKFPFKSPLGFEDSNVQYISGSGIPGNTSETDNAPIGSRYIDYSSNIEYKKDTSGTGTDKWSIASAVADGNEGDLQINAGDGTLGAIPLNYDDVSRSLVFSSGQFDEEVNFILENDSFLDTRIQLSGPSTNNYFTISDPDSGNILFSFNSDGKMGIGDNSISEAKLFITPNSTTTGDSANVDIRAKASGQESTIEVQHHDFTTTFKSAYLQYTGSTVPGTTIDSIPTADSARLVFQNASNSLIYTSNNTPIVLGVNSTEVGKITSSGFESRRSLILNDSVEITDLNNGDLWLAANAIYDESNTEWNRVDDTRAAFAWDIRGSSNFPMETEQGVALWVAAPDTNPIGDFAAVGGWELALAVTETKNLIVGGYGIEIDGNGILPYFRSVAAPYDNDTYRGSLSNLFLDFSGRDDDTEESWFYGLVGDSFQIKRLAGSDAISPGNFDMSLLVSPSGKVAIQTTTANSNLNVAGAGNGIFEAGQAAYGGDYTGISLVTGLSAGAYNMMSSPTDNTLYINRPSGSPISFRENHVEQMVLDSDGKLGLGVSPQTTLHVESSSITRFRMKRSTNAGYFELTPATDDRTYIRHFAPTGNAELRLEAIVQDGTSESWIKFFQGVQTSGASGIMLYDSSNNTDIIGEISASGGDSYLLNTNFGFGTTTPTSIIEAAVDDRINGSILTLTNAAVGSSIFQPGDIVGGLVFNSEDTGGERAWIKAIKGGIDDANAFDFVQIAFAASQGTNPPVEGMRLTDTGLGLGTSNPEEALHISGPGNERVRVESTGTNTFIGYFSRNDAGVEGSFGVFSSLHSLSHLRNKPIFNANSSADGLVISDSSGAGIEFYLNGLSTTANRVGFWTTTGLGLGTSSPSATAHIIGDMIVDYTGTGGNAIKITERSSGFGGRIAWLDDSGSPAVAINKDSNDNFVVYTGSDFLESDLIVESGGALVSKNQRWESEQVIIADNATHYFTSNINSSNANAGFSRYEVYSDTQPEQAGACDFFGDTNSTTVVIANSGISIGDTTNPNVSGDLNIWMDNGYVRCQNLTGSTKTVTLTRRSAS